ncbi:MAG TPA: protein translocase subunit SecF [Gemmatimonadales bacterium]|nr:protein translocase subunit SecF [Gemmatimonadales bacterium]
MIRIFNNTNFDFLGKWRIASTALVAFIVPALLWIIIGGFNYSVEFTGGTLMQIEFVEDQDVGRVRNALGSAGIESAELQRFGSDRELVIRASGAADVARQVEGAETVVASIRQALDQEFGEDAYTVIRTEAVGPRVGGELRQRAIIALLISFGVTLIYLAWRFEWRFGVAALVSTIADILATAALMRYINLEVSLFVVGGLLTVLGYSLNDKIVVFDRVRENLKKFQKEALSALLNRSVNETLPRTVMTGTTTLATLLALLVFGGEVIRPFAIVLTFGIVVGTFSSMFIAPSVLLKIEQRWPHAIGARRVTTEGTAPATQS